jgi:hypothetical protein
MQTDCIAAKHLLLQMAEHWRGLAECADKDEMNHLRRIAS